MKKLDTYSMNKIIDRALSVYEKNYGKIQGSFYDRCDLKNECWIKILKLGQKVDDNYENLPFNEFRAWITNCLQNYIIDKLRGFNRRLETTKSSSYRIESPDELDFIFENLSLEVKNNKSPAAMPEKRYNDLLSLIECFIEQSDDFVKDYLREAINPSQNTIIEFEKIKSKNTSMKNLSHIPPMTLRRILGYKSHMKFSTKISVPLKNYLYKHGYHFSMKELLPKYMENSNARTFELPKHQQII